MKLKYFHFSLAVSILSSIVLAACGTKTEKSTLRENATETPSPAEADDEEPSELPSMIMYGEDITSDAGGIEDDGDPQYSDNAANSISPADGGIVPETTAKRANSATNSKNAAKPATGGRTEKLYISTYGANGKVWGYVTMNGKTGHGTIHDEGENSLSITVTRHGGELYGVDQNGRQYVFKM